MKANPLPTMERLREVLDYQPETGIFTWLVSPNSRVRAGDVAGSTRADGRVMIRIDAVRYQASRLAWFYVTGKDPGELEIDHRNRVESDNRFSNFRLATLKQNQENRGLNTNNTSGARGVSYSARLDRWVAYITHNRKRITLGEFRSLDAAKARREKAERDLFTHSDASAQ